MFSIDYWIKEVLKFMKKRGVILKLLTEDNGRYGLKIVGLDSELSGKVYDWFYRYKNNEF